MMYKRTARRPITISTSKKPCGNIRNTRTRSYSHFEIKRLSGGDTVIHLETDRLILRDYTEIDFEAYYSSHCHYDKEGYPYDQYNLLFF